MQKSQFALSSIDSPTFSLAWKHRGSAYGLRAHAESRRAAEPDATADWATMPTFWPSC